MFQRALKGVFTRFLPYRTEDSEEELPPEYAHLPICEYVLAFPFFISQFLHPDDATELRHSAIRSENGGRVAYHSEGREARPDSGAGQRLSIQPSLLMKHVVPMRKRKRAKSPSLFDFLKRRHKKQVPIRPETPPPRKRMRRHRALNASSDHHPAVLTTLLSRKPTRPGANNSKSTPKPANGDFHASGDSGDDSSGSDEVQYNTMLRRSTQAGPSRQPARNAKNLVERDAPDTQLGPQQWNPWPDGTWETTYTREYFEQCQFSIHWACEVRGGKKNSLGSSRAAEKGDGAHTFRLCQGVMKCTSATCDILTRPQTKNAGRIRQIEAGCSCGSPLRHYRCDVQIEYWVYRDGAHFRHSGYHHHERVPVRHLTLRERSQFENVVNEHPRMGPAQLLAGRPAVDGPGPSVADISSVFLNPHRIQYERRKILNPENKVCGPASFSPPHLLI